MANGLRSVLAVSHAEAAHNQELARPRLLQMVVPIVWAQQHKLVILKPAQSVRLNVVVRIQKYLQVHLLLNFAQRELQLQLQQLQIPHPVLLLLTTLGNVKHLLAVLPTVLQPVLCVRLQEFQKHGLWVQTPAQVIPIRI